MVENKVKVGHKEVTEVSDKRKSTGEVLFGFFDRAEAEAKTHKKGFASFCKSEKEIKK